MLIVVDIVNGVLTASRVKNKYSAWTPVVKARQ
jgi:hypothetical protein